jgi:amino acid transporter
MQALAERGMGPKQLAYVDKKGRPLYGVVIQLLFGLLAFIGESNKQDIVFNWLLALSGLSFFFIWAAICLAHIRFRHAWKVQGHIKGELPYEAMFGVMGSWYGLILNILCMTATFYVALFVSSHPLRCSTIHHFLSWRAKLIFRSRPAHPRHPKCPSFLQLLSRSTNRHSLVFGL